MKIILLWVCRLLKNWHYSLQMLFEEKGRNCGVRCIATIRLYLCFTRLCARSLFSIRVTSPLEATLFTAAARMAFFMSMNKFYLPQYTSRFG
jgi:hypothetical protein